MLNESGVGPLRLPLRLVTSDDDDDVSGEDAGDGDDDADDEDGDGSDELITSHSSEIESAVGFRVGGG